MSYAPPSGPARWASIQALRRAGKTSTESTSKRVSESAARLDRSSQLLRDSEGRLARRVHVGSHGPVG